MRTNFSAPAVNDDPLDAEVIPPATRLRNKRKRQEKQTQLFKECMDVMHNKRRKGNQNSQPAIQAHWDNPAPAPQSTSIMENCYCGKDLLTNNDDTSTIQCDTCQTWLHISCTSLGEDSAVFAVMSELRTMQENTSAQRQPLQ